MTITGRLFADTNLRKLQLPEEVDCRVLHGTKRRRSACPDFWTRVEVLGDIDPELAAEWVAEISRDFTDAEMSFEVRRLGRTITSWADQIWAWHRSRVTNGPTEAVNNLAKRIKRGTFGLVNLRHHRVRCLLYADRRNWDLLPTIQP